jgi:hypothetical protein
VGVKDAGGDVENGAASRRPDLIDADVLGYHQTKTQTRASKTSAADELDGRVLPAAPHAPQHAERPARSRRDGEGTSETTREATGTR